MAEPGHPVGLCHLGGTSRSCSASHPFWRRELLPCPRDFCLSNPTNACPLTNHFWEFTGEVLRGDFSPSHVVLQSLFERSGALTHVGFLQSVCVPVTWQECRSCSQGWCNECLSMLLLLCGQSCVLGPQTHCRPTSLQALSQQVVN